MFSVKEQDIRGDGFTVKLEGAYAGQGKARLTVTNRIGEICTMTFSPAGDLLTVENSNASSGVVVPS